MPSILFVKSRITAAMTTGPAKEPLPASSTPINLPELCKKTLSNLYREFIIPSEAQRIDGRNYYPVYPHFFPAG